MGNTGIDFDLLQIVSSYAKYVIFKIESNTHFYAVQYEKVIEHFDDHCA